MRQIGNMRSVVALYDRAPTTSGGESRAAWPYVGAYAAEVRGQTDRAFSSGDARYHESVIFVVMRALRTRRIVSGMRLSYLGTLYDIRDVVTDTPLPGFVKLRCLAVEMEGATIDRH